MQKNSLAIRLGVWFLVLSIFPLAILAVFVLNDVADAFDTLALDHQRKQVQLLAAALPDISQTKVFASLQENALEETDRLYLVDLAGYYLFHPNQNKVNTSMSDDFGADIVKKILSGTTDAAKEAQTGQVIGFTPVPSQEGNILIMVSADALGQKLMSAIRSSSQIQISVGLLIISVAAGIAIWLVVGQPVRQLTQVAEQIGRGNLDVALDPEETVDELQVLALTFNQMTKQLRTLFRDLEQKVDELAQAEEAVRASERYFRTLLANAQDTITVLNADGTYRFESPAAERTVGYKPEELLGKSAFDFIHPEDRSVVLEVFQQGLEQPRGPQRIEFRFQHRDGSWRYLESIGQNLLHDPVVQGIVVNSRDITERKQLEEQIRQIQKMEAIGQLAGGIAHDFNNILVPISLYTEMALRKLSPDEKLYANLQVIREAAGRAADLTRQILAFSRRQVLDMRVLDLNAVVEDFQKMLQRLIGENITLETFLESDLYPVRADKAQIEQVLLNLAVNARDAMPAGGKLTLETANVYLDEAYISQHADTLLPGYYVMLTVSDTGHGMDATTQQRIFEPFFTTKAPGKGTGLGLATVFGIVKQHEGNIYVYSETDKGTTFKIYLPRVEGIVETSDATITPPVTLRGTETILVFEDDVVVRKLIGETLIGHGYHVIEAQNIEDGLQHAATYKGAIHLLLTDVIMPEMNGQELYQHIATLHPTIKVLYMSGYTDNVVVHHGILEPGINFLQKPFTIDNLTRKVRQILDEA
ncbi:MAG: PAS domain S-box protein [Anaerolineae bacterium]|nr:PAS domain S-box protein [Anaerolineae bacterium]